MSIRSIKNNKIWKFYFTFIYSFSNILSLCRSEFPTCAIFLRCEEFLAFLARQIYWWQISSIFVCLRKSLFPVHFWGITFWVQNSSMWIFLSTFIIVYSTFFLLICVLRETRYTWCNSYPHFSTGVFFPFTFWFLSRFLSFIFFSRWIWYTQHSIDFLLCILLGAWSLNFLDQWLGVCL